MSILIDVLERVCAFVPQHFVLSNALDNLAHKYIRYCRTYLVAHSSKAGGPSWRTILSYAFTDGNKAGSRRRRRRLAHLYDMSDCTGQRFELSWAVGILTFCFQIKNGLRYSPSLHDSPSGTRADLREYNLFTGPDRFPSYSIFMLVLVFFICKFEVTLMELKTSRTRLTLCCRTARFRSWSSAVELHPEQMGLSSSQYHPHLFGKRLWQDTPLCVSSSCGQSNRKSLSAHPSPLHTNEDVHLVGILSIRAHVLCGMSISSPAAMRFE